MVDFNLQDLSPYAEGAFMTTLLADWAQTRQLSRSFTPNLPKGYTGGTNEQNPILGQHPTQGKVNTYMPLAGLAHYAGYSMLPDSYKLPYALASTLFEGKTVLDNKRKHGLDINPGALGLGALATIALQNEWSKRHKASVGVNKVDSTYVPTLKMEF